MNIAILVGVLMFAIPFVSMIIHIRKEEGNTILTHQQYLRDLDRAIRAEGLFTTSFINQKDN